MATDIYVKNGKDFMIKIQEIPWYYCNSYKCQRYYPQSNFYRSHIKREIKRCKNCMQDNIGKTASVEEDHETDISPSVETNSTIYHAILLKLRSDCQYFAKQNQLVWKKVDLDVKEIASLLDFWKSTLPQNISLNIPNDVYLMLWNDTVRTEDNSIRVELFDVVPFARAECRSLRHIPVALRPVLLEKSNKQWYDHIMQITAEIKLNVLSQKQKFIEQLLVNEERENECKEKQEE